MQLPEFTSSADTVSDAELVAASLAGDRNAFGRVVERYQRLLCSVAYSSTGSLSESEDIAQEAFVTAWRHLRALKEPDKLRPWLCGILRHCVGRLRRGNAREPIRQADTLEVADEVSSADEPTPDLAMKKEEQALLWSTLERVPELYREPLVLYYREHQSVEHVAVALDLTEDAVKQRLARGRKILQEQMLSFVEGALARSTPGRVFTLGVLAALPAMLPTPAKAIGLGAMAAHGSMVAKTTSIAALLVSISGVVSAVMTLRANLDQARTPLERRAVVKITIAAFFGAFGYLGLLWLCREGAFRWSEHRVMFAWLCQALVVVGIVLWSVGLTRAMRRIRVLRTSERKKHPELFMDPVDHVGSQSGEYRSRWKLLGVPLVRVRFASPDEGDAPVFAWFAGGDRAYGLVCAWGGVAVAPLSVGAISVGLLSIGSLSVGLISLGTLAVGAWSLGCASIGLKAFAWLSALGWQSAAGGGFAIAGNAAIGPIPLAPHANDAIAYALLANPHADRDQTIFYIVVVVLSLVPVAGYARAVRQRLGAKARSK